MNRTTLFKKYLQAKKILMVPINDKEQRNCKWIALADVKYCARTRVGRVARSSK
jgi:hypothetical protein